MELFLDITLGLGLALAAGIRPFLPLLAVAAFARADFRIDFSGTDYAVIQSPEFMLVVVLALIGVVVLQRKLGPASNDEGPLGAAIGGAAIGAGALLFAGVLAADGYLAWPGIPAGIAAAALSQGATRNLVRRTRARLDEQAQHALTVYLDGVSILVTVLSVLVPPISIIFAIALAWIWLGGRRRDSAKYAGLRVLKK